MSRAMKKTQNMTEFSANAIQQILPCIYYQCRQISDLHTVQNHSIKSEKHGYYILKTKAQMHSCWMHALTMCCSKPWRIKVLYCISHSEQQHGDEMCVFVRMNPYMLMCAFNHTHCWKTYFFLGVKKWGRGYIATQMHIPTLHQMCCTACFHLKWLLFSNKFYLFLIKNVSFINHPQSETMSQETKNKIIASNILWVFLPGCDCLCK